MAGAENILHEERLHHVPLVLYYVFGCNDERGEMRKGRMRGRFLENGREWRLPNLLHANNLVLCGKSKQDLKVMVERFVEVCRRRDLKINADKNKVMASGGEEGLDCLIHVEGA